MPKNCNWLTPSWSVPANVRALTTLRGGGYSTASYEALNLGLHVEDDVSAVLANRRLLIEQAKLPTDPFWLTQVHGTQVVEAVGSPLVEADASVAFAPGQVCCVLTADCLPLLLCHQKGSCVSAIHAGWRGLASGVIEAAIEKLNCEPKDLLAWMGPAIGPKTFEVGEDVLLAFKGSHTEASFQSKGNGKWLANLYDLAKVRLKRAGVSQIFGGDFCTYSDPTQFYSFRRSKKTGRMATLIWMEET